jgi:transposase-like protein
MNMTDPIFSDETKAREYFEAIRWPNGPFCPHCGETQKVYRLNGQSHRPGLVHCNGCNEAFTVTVGSVMERSHVPLTKWALAFRLMTSSKKGISAHQLHRTIDVTYKTAWFMAHRIREAMDDKGASGPLGGDGKTVEVDETGHGPSTDVFVSGKGWQKKPGLRGKRDVVVSLVERGGRVRSFRLDGLDTDKIDDLVASHVLPKSTLNTDEARFYQPIGRRFAAHGTVNHGEEEYAKADGTTTNTVEGYFSIFKRGMVGVYQHCGAQHLHCYLAEFDFRYSNRVALGVDDVLRTMRAIKGAEGKRLTYRQPRGAKQAQA